MTVAQSPLHFNPLRPSRDHLAAVSWSEAQVERSSDSSPFAYFHEPYVGFDAEAALSFDELGSYNRESQQWEFPGEDVSMGVYTKTRTTSTTPTASYPGEQPDWNYVTDDACQ